MSKKQGKNGNAKLQTKSDYLFSMSYAPKIDESVHWLQLLPIAFFGAFVIIIVICDIEMLNINRTHHCS